jgi:hypothetical protein
MHRVYHAALEQVDNPPRPGQQIIWRIEIKVRNRGSHRRRVANWRDGFVRQIVHNAIQKSA